MAQLAALAAPIRHLCLTCGVSVGPLTAPEADSLRATGHDIQPDPDAPPPVRCAVCGRAAEDAYTDRAAHGPEAFPCCTPTFSVVLPDGRYIGRSDLNGPFGPAGAAFAACYETFASASVVARTHGGTVWLSPYFDAKTRRYVHRPLPA